MVHEFYELGLDLCVVFVNQACFGFVLFRILDIFKPWPISVVDRQVGGGLGIMLDDLIAGVMGAVCIHALIVLGV